MVLDTFCCLASSYMYAFLACYGHESERSTSEFWLEGAFELIFFISIVKNFLTDFKVPGETYSEKRITVIANRYLKGTFMVDFLPMLPFGLMIPHHEMPDGKLFYLLKIIRLKRGLKVFDVNAWIRALKRRKEAGLKRLLDQHPELGEDNSKDMNGIDNMLYCGFVLKAFKLVIIIFNFSYFLGMLWYIVSDIIERSVLYYREIYPYDGPVNT